MKFQTLEKKMINEIGTVAREMSAVGEDEREAFKQIHTRLKEMSPEVTAAMLSLALMTLAANAMVANERILHSKKNRAN
jgi:hypothetical protein